MACLGELDRRSTLLDLDAPAYLLLCLAVAILLVPRLQRVSGFWLLAVAFPVYVVLELLSGPLVPADAQRLLMGFLGPAIAIVLSSRLAGDVALADDAFGELALGRPREPVAPFARTQGPMFREVRRARRYERPLSLLAIAAQGSQAPTALTRLLEETRRESLDRVVDIKVGALLDDQTAGSALIAGHNGHFLVLLPEAGHGEAEQLAKRLEQVAGERHGIALSFGIASFPTQELTFDKLLETAEAELRAKERASHTPEPGSAPHLAPSSTARG